MWFASFLYGSNKLEDYFFWNITSFLIYEDVFSGLDALLTDQFSCYIFTLEIHIQYMACRSKFFLWRMWLSLSHKKCQFLPDLFLGSLDEEFLVPLAAKKGICSRVLNSNLLFIQYTSLAQRWCYKPFPWLLKPVSSWDTILSYSSIHSVSEHPVTSNQHQDYQTSTCSWCGMQIKDWAALNPMWETSE